MMFLPIHSTTKWKSWHALYTIDADCKCGVQLLLRTGKANILTVFVHNSHYPGFSLKLKLISYTELDLVPKKEAPWITNSIRNTLFTYQFGQKADWSIASLC